MATATIPVPKMTESLEKQREYTLALQKKDFKFTMVVGDAFVRGMRDLGYKHSGTALAELVDNSVQAEASEVHIVLHTPTGKKSVDKIAIIDNGHGMDAPMIRACVLWGGTHREGDRNGFGRYGYGLPSASVSQGRRYTVFSRTENAGVTSVEVDLDDIQNGEYTDRDGHIIVPEPIDTELPKWIGEYIDVNFRETWNHGTVIMIEKLDKLTWSTVGGLVRNLSEHFGTVYHKYIPNVRVVLDGKDVEPLDPLFTTPGARFFSLSGAPDAEALPSQIVSVKAGQRRLPAGTIKVRYSLMPPGFGQYEDDVRAKLKSKSKYNPRMKIAETWSGMKILRHGRLIDVVKPPRLWGGSWENYDRWVGVELDFSPSLDEEFSLTTSKQQIRLSDRIWEILEKAGVKTAVKQLKQAIRDRHAIANSEKKAERSAVGKRRKSEEIAAKGEESRTRPPRPRTPEEQRKAKEKLRERARQAAVETGEQVEEVIAAIEESVAKCPYLVVEKEQSHGPFFWVEQHGGQKVLYINTKHAFYRTTYASERASARDRTRLELVLLSLGDAMLEANQQGQLFYERELRAWSENLSIWLQLLESEQDERDSVDAFADA